MTDALDPVRAHYNPTGLTARLRAALAVFGPEHARLTPRELAPLDQFHTRGAAATAEIAELAGITRATAVLDVGSGIGGPARLLAASRGCRVTGIDLSEPFVDAARYLTGRTGQADAVSFQVADALTPGFEGPAFDVVLMQHVAMNIADRERLYRGLKQVLRPGGRLAIHDIVATGAAPHYPLPWARTPATSFLLTASQTRSAVESAGFGVLSWRDDTGLARDWVAELRAAGPPPTPNLSLVMGADFGDLVANLATNLMEGRLGVVTAVLETP